MLANDQLGDCTAAGAFHIAGSWLANNKLPVTFTVDDVVRFYSETTGYVKGRPDTDNGGDLETVMNYWLSNGLTTTPPHRAQAWVSVNSLDPVEMKSALWLFGNLYIGINMPDEYVNPMPENSGFVWDVGGPPVEDNGHCFCALGYDEKAFKINTGGMVGDFTVDAMLKYGPHAAKGEVYSVLGPDWVDVASELAPNGFKIADLVADIHGVKAE
jgi:hypothetical protein